MEIVVTGKMRKHGKEPISTSVWSRLLRYFQLATNCQAYCKRIAADVQGQTWRADAELKGEGEWVLKL